MLQVLLNAGIFISFLGVYAIVYKKTALIMTVLRAQLCVVILCCPFLLVSKNFSFAQKVFLFGVALVIAIWICLELEIRSGRSEDE